MSEKLTPYEIEKFAKEWLEVTVSLSRFIKKSESESKKIKENQS